MIRIKWAYSAQNLTFILSTSCFLLVLLQKTVFPVLWRTSVSQFNCVSRDPVGFSCHYSTVSSLQILEVLLQPMCEKLMHSGLCSNKKMLCTMHLSQYCNGLEINSTSEVCKLCSLCRYWAISGSLWRMRQRNMSKFLQTLGNLSGQIFLFAKTNPTPNFPKNLKTYFSMIEFFFFKNQNHSEENMNKVFSF